jgi:hypothetical protein
MGNPSFFFSPPSALSTTVRKGHSRGRVIGPLRLSGDRRREADLRKSGADTSSSTPNAYQSQPQGKARLNSLQDHTP